MPEKTDIKTIKFNDIEFTPIEGVDYRHDYVKLDGVIKQILKDDLINGDARVTALFRQLILTDLFFILYFVMGIKGANHPFVVKMCKVVEDGPKTQTLDVWARGHFKSTIITVAETAQYHLINPEHCTCIFSYKKAAADKFLDSIRKTYESNFMKACFPDKLFDNPKIESPSWGVEKGITIKREGTSRPQKTIQASGLIEGMLTGDHFERRIYDDVETKDVAKSPDQLALCYEMFDMSKNLGMTTGINIERIIGTYYSHVGAVVRIRDKKNIKGETIYKARIIPATEDGTAKGKPVLLSQEELNDKMTDDGFNSQQLCDPTPTGDRKLDGTLLIDVSPDEIPSSLHKFMLIDPAGDNDTKSKGVRGDDWGVLVIGVEGGAGDDMGARNIYILDAFDDVAGETEIIEILTRMYLRNGLIMRVGYERNLNTTPGWLVHFLNALKARQVTLSEDRQNLVRLKHGGRNKVIRITSALQMPLLHGKIRISTTVPKVYRDVLREELDKFPYWQDGGIDAMAYLWDILDDPYVAQMIATSPLGSKKKNNLLYFPKRDIMASSNLGWMGG